MHGCAGRRGIIPQTRGGGGGGERAPLCQIPRHHTLHPRPTSNENSSERPTRAQQRVVAARRGRAGTAAPDTAAPYTQPRGPNPRTTAYGGRKERESEHGCARSSGIIPSNERGGGGGERARLCQIPWHHTLHPRPTSIVNPRGRPTRAQQRVVAARRGRAGTAVPDTAASYTQPRGPNPRTTAYGGRN